MKIDRQDRTTNSSPVKRCFTPVAGTLATLTIVVSLGVSRTNSLAQAPTSTPYPAALPAQATQQRFSPESATSIPPGTQSPPNTEISEAERAASQQKAEMLITQVIDRMANGNAYFCKLRQRVRTAGREVVGIGEYHQVGGGTGQFSWDIKLHDGNGKHTLQQFSDGRLAWTRRNIAGKISLSRVDVIWLDEGARALRRDQRIKPSMLVGGPSEMLDTIRRDYDLKLGTSSLAGRPLLVIIGNLKKSRRDAIQADRGGAPLPELYPTRVNVAVAQLDDPETGFGKGLPIRIEHFSDPIDVPEATNQETGSQLKRRQMISLLEFYAIHPIAPPPIEKFRFTNQDAGIDFVNETSRYEDQFDIRVSAKERAKFR